MLSVLAPIALPTGQSEEDRQVMQHLSDEIQQNMADTLTLKRNLSAVEQKLKENRKELRKKTK